MIYLTDEFGAKIIEALKIVIPIISLQVEKIRQSKGFQYRLKLSESITLLEQLRSELLNEGD